MRKRIAFASVVFVGVIAAGLLVTNLRSKQVGKFPIEVSFETVSNGEVRVQEVLNIHKGLMVEDSVYIGPFIRHERMVTDYATQTAYHINDGLGLVAAYDIGLVDKNGVRHDASVPESLSIGDPESNCILGNDQFLGYDEVVGYKVAVMRHVTPAGMAKLYKALDLECLMVKVELNGSVKSATNIKTKNVPKNRSLIPTNYQTLSDVEFIRRSLRQEHPNMPDAELALKAEQVAAPDRKINRAAFTVPERLKACCGSKQ